MIVAIIPVKVLITKLSVFFKSHEPASTLLGFARMRRCLSWADHHFLGLFRSPAGGIP